MRVLAAVGIIDMTGAQTMRPPVAAAGAAE